MHSVIICVVFSGAYMRCTRLCSLNPGVTEVVSEQMLTVGWNLDRNGQNPYLLTILWFILYLPYLDHVSPFAVILWLLLSFLLWDKIDFTPWNPTFMTFLRGRRPKTKLKLFSLCKKMLVDCSDDKCRFASLIDWNIIDGHLSMYHHKVMK
jgi:hypothetical protein